MGQKIPYRKKGGFWPMPDLHRQALVAARAEAAALTVAALAGVAPEAIDDAVAALVAAAEQAMARWQTPDGWHW